ncbi:MAG: peptide-binding protein [Pseudorhodobacter sp.]|nr:MAG: peptide-binding protein [Pseudorhodobacter sp.]
MKGLILLAALVSAAPAFGQVSLPALHDVTGVAAYDVLNIRAEPKASAALLGSLPPDHTGIEVVALSPDGKWGLVNTGETSGWASMAYLARRPEAEWFAMQNALHCSGTEPFWGAGFDAGMTNAVQFSSPDSPKQTFDLISVWPGETWRPVAGLTFAAADATGMAVIRAEACSDGMSDRTYGLSVDLFLTRNMGGDSHPLRGCCSLVP